MRRRLFLLGGLLLLFTIVNAAIFFFTRWRTSKTDKAVIQAMEESLSRSNRSISNSTQIILHSLDEKIKEPETSTKAAVWLPRARQIREISTELYNYINKIKKRNEVSADMYLELLQKIKTYKENILHIDPSISANFETTVIITRPRDASDASKNSLYKPVFIDASKNAFLTKLQSDILNFENIVITFCNEQTSRGCVLSFDTYYAIISQSTHIVRPGKYFEIIAGVGVFSKASLPEININGKIVPLGEDGASIFKQKAPHKAGKYFVPVRIKYTNQDGKEQLIEKLVEYTVAKECDQ